MSFNLAEYAHFWESRIARDLATFKDPGTDLQLSRDGSRVFATWSQRSSMRSATFVVTEHGVDVQWDNVELSYRSFLSSPEMSDLLGLAKMILTANRPRLYVNTLAKWSDGDDSGEGPAADVMHDVLVSNRASDSTTIVMVTGEAGAGKTSTLRQLVTSSAHDYVNGTERALLLYVNAQGRALARLNEALATELQDLRAVLTYHSVSALVRNGLLIPVIDGFDELLGVGGYDDAFSSLATFIEDLDGNGQVIASARSTYYEHEFTARANRKSALGSHIWKQVPVEILAWTHAQVREYTNLRATSDTWSADATSRIVSDLDRIFSGRNRGLQSKPFFVAKTVDLLIAGTHLQGDDDLLDEMIAAFLERERSEKLLGRLGSPLLRADQLASLLVELATEMWNQQTRELDALSVREAAEYVLLSESIDEDARTMIIERMPSMAFLAPGSRSGSVAFEHENFMSYFLATCFAQSVLSSAPALASLLGRSVLPFEVAQVMTHILTEPTRSFPTSQILSSLESAISVGGPRSAQVRENAGLIVSRLLETRHATTPCINTRIASLAFPGASLCGVIFENCSFEDVEFRRTDLRTTKFRSCSCRNLLLNEVLIDPLHTRLELTGLDPVRNVIGLQRVDSDGGISRLYDPSDIYASLVGVGAAPIIDLTPNIHQVAPEQRALLERFVRAFNRSNPVCTSDQSVSSVVSHRSWPKIERLLIEFGVVTSEVRSTGGPQKTFLRRQVLPDEIMLGGRIDAPVSESVRRFWQAFQEMFPAP